MCCMGVLHVQVGGVASVEPQEQQQLSGLLHPPLWGWETQVSVSGACSIHSTWRGAEPLNPVLCAVPMPHGSCFVTRRHSSESWL
jgi:hypothetical protein